VIDALMAITLFSPAVALGFDPARSGLSDARIAQLTTPL
jgi:hypothetical protein